MKMFDKHWNKLGKCHFRSKACLIMMITGWAEHCINAVSTDGYMDRLIDSSYIDNLWSHAGELDYTAVRALAVDVQKFYVCGEYPARMTHWENVRKHARSVYVRKQNTLLDPKTSSNVLHRHSTTQTWIFQCRDWYSDESGEGLSLLISWWASCTRDHAIHNKWNKERQDQKVSRR